jgi:hypothetical protein
MKQINNKYRKKIWEIYQTPEFVTKPRGMKIAEVFFKRKKIKLRFYVW